MIDDITVIIRSSNERTEAACYAIIEKQVHFKNIFVLNEKPFYNAVIKGFKVGMEQQKKWTLTVDADLLLKSNAIEEMIRRAGSLKGDLFIYQGYVLDKLFGRCREGGPHLYATRHLDKALRILESQPDSLRPESYTYRIMAEQGYSYHVDTQIYGLHDYEQYNLDIIRKAFFHSKKHDKPKLVKEFLLHWLDNFRDDCDYKMAFLGLTYGLFYNGKLEVDAEFFEKISNKIASVHSIEEKDYLKSNQWNGTFVDRIINDHLKVQGLKGLKKKQLPKRTKPFLRFNLFSRVRRKIGSILSALGKKMSDY